MTGEPENHEDGVQQRDIETAIHNLRNPVSSIWSAVEFLVEDAADTLTEDQMKLLRGIGESSLSMLKIIDSVANPGRRRTTPLASPDLG